MISLFVFTSNMRGMNYGVGTYISQLTSSLLKHPEIRIFHVNYYSDKYKEFTTFKGKSGIYKIFIPCPKLINSDEKYTAKYSARVIDLITGIIRNSQNVIFQVNYPTALPFVKEIKRRFNHPVLSVIHSANWQFLAIGNKQKFINVWKNRQEYDFNDLRELLQEKELYELVDKIVSVTAYMKRFVSEYYNIEENKIIVIPNGIDNSLFVIPDRVEKIKMKEQLGFRANEKILLFSGRLDNGKGLHLLLQAFNEVFKRNKNVRLVIMGEDSGMEKISEFLTYCKDSWSMVSFTGFLKHEDVLKFYQIADIGVIPSLYDHCPYVVMEMMSYNIPLIISNTEGLNEMLTDKQAVYLEPIYDDKRNISFNISEMANAILSLVEDEQKMNQIIDDYKELINTKFSINQMAGEMYKILKSLSGVESADFPVSEIHDNLKV